MVGGKHPISQCKNDVHIFDSMYIGFLPSEMSFCGTRRRVGVPELLCSV